MKTRHQTIILLIGIVICATCALFPPRRLVLPQDQPLINRGGSVPHAYAFADDFRVYKTTRADGMGLAYAVEVDGGSLLVELMLVASLTGILVLIPRLIKP